MIGRETEMDDTTKAVKDMYEQYPYPSGVPTMRTGFAVERLLSLVSNAPATAGGLAVLDAGCGRGLGLIGAASLQPDIQFTGVDINSVGLADAQQNAQARGLTNIRFVQADLMTLEGVDVPPGGFDVIYSSGVLHHLSDPQTGLQKLRDVLAPHGVIALMVYGSYGRQALYRVIEGIGLLTPGDRKINERLPVARLLARVADDTVFKGNCWQGTAGEDDVEFVDRCLNVNETSYDIDGLWQLLEATGMQFVRWAEPADWAPGKLFHDPQLLALATALDEVDRYRLVERLFDRSKLELYICKDGNGRRAPLTDQQLETATVAVNPEVSFVVEKRNLNQSQRIESLSYKLQSQAVMPLTNPLLAQVCMLLVDQTTRFAAAELLAVLLEQGTDRPTALAILRELLDREILYAPH
jgi:SAM-dependent methyltransferase